MSGRLLNRVALVTGGGSGIGKAISELLAEEGATIIISGRRQEPIANLACELRNRGLSTAYYVLDISNKDEVSNAIGEITSKFGCIDLLVNNAGIINCESEDSVDLLVEMEKVIKTNFFGTVHVTKFVIDNLIDHKKKGTIVNIASICASQGCSGYSIYSASKGAVVSFSKSIAATYAKLGIRVNCISPGVIHTPMSYVETKDFDLRVDEFDKAHPLGRVGKPTDIAKAVLFLSSDDSEWITGQDIIVDGGWLLRNQ